MAEYQTIIVAVVSALSSEVGEVLHLKPMLSGCA